MVKTTLTINGMMCSMCESHINETVRKAFPAAKKVSSSHTKGLTEIISEEAPDEAALRDAIAATGYEMTGYRTEPYEKKRFGFFGR